MIDEVNQLFSFCIVWTLIPCISWICPWVGHTGICSSEGIICDFMGYRINKRHMAFGKPLKYVRLDPIPAQDYDQSLEEVNNIYEGRAHNLCCNNCHHHVADVLNRLSYRGRQDWSQLSIWWMCLWQSSYTSKCGVVWTYLPLVGVLLVLAFFHLALNSK